jgi:hypothetical protein
VLKLDRPRRIDRVIDYFGTAPALVMLSVTGRTVNDSRRERA